MDYEGRFSGHEIDQYLENSKQLAELENNTDFSVESDWNIGSFSISKSGHFVEINVRGLKWVRSNPSEPTGPFLVATLPEGWRPRFDISSALNDTVRIFTGSVTIYADGRIVVLRKDRAVPMPTNAALHFTYIISEIQTP